MLEKTIRFSIRHRWLMLLLTLALAALGVWSYSKLPIDATPDITNVQVQINTEAPGYSPLEAEQRVTFPIETALAGLARLDYTRSLSRYGLSQVTVVFEDGTDIYLPDSRLPSACSTRNHSCRMEWSRNSVPLRPASVKSTCTPSTPSSVRSDRMARHGRQRICERSRTGSFDRSCAIPRA